MEAKNAGTILQSLDRGTKIIDHVLLRGIETANINRAGQFMFGLGFHTNHRGLFVEMDEDQLLGLCMQEPEQRDGQQLSSKNTKYCQQYLEQLCKHLEAHDIQKRVGKLSSVSQKRTLTEEEVLEYNKIDDCITKGILAAENSLPRKRERGWTAEVNTMIHRV